MAREIEIDSRRCIENMQSSKSCPILHRLMTLSARHLPRSRRLVYAFSAWCLAFLVASAILMAVGWQSGTFSAHLAGAIFFMLLAMPWSLGIRRQLWQGGQIEKALGFRADLATTAALFALSSISFISVLVSRSQPYSLFFVVGNGATGMLGLLAAAICVVRAGVIIVDVFWACNGKETQLWKLERSMAIVLWVLLVVVSLVFSCMPVAVVWTEIHMPSLPREADGYVLCVLSDIHAGPLTSSDFLTDLAQQTLAVGCRAIVLDGDIAEGPTELRSKQMANLLNIVDAPDGAYYVPGNHEYYNVGADRDAVAWTTWWDTHGVKSLNNTSVLLPRSGPFALRLAGTDDVRGHPNIGHAVAVSSNGDFPIVPTILAAHNPVPHIYDAARAGVELQVSGHTHGGQLWPIHFPTWFTSKGYISGLYRWKDTALYVSEGSAGSYVTPLRLLTRSEITVIRLHSSGTASRNSSNRDNSAAWGVGASFAAFVLSVVAVLAVCIRNTCCSQRSAASMAPEPA